MNLRHIKTLSEKPALHEKGNSVMWTDPHISKQLLQLHINPENDIASRSKAKINIISNWILENTFNHPVEMMDLGCGPGLYTEWFAQKGYSVTGVDFSENSIHYAIRQAKEKQLDITYLHKNYLDLNFTDQFDLVMMIYLDFCALLPEERDKVLEVVWKSLKKGGVFVCDVVNDRNIDRKITSQAWEVQENGFWKDKPYIALTNGYHYPEAGALANQHIVIDENDEVATYIFWNHYYNREDLVNIFTSKGFSEIATYENVLPESDDCWNGENVTFCIARK